MIKNITIMIQARTGSRRFPKKVLAKIQKKYLIWHVINRVKKVRDVESIFLLTTKKEEDKILLKIAKKAGINTYVGSSKNVLNRYFSCAEKIGTKHILRITGDCPLIDHKIIEKLIKIYKNGNYDYVTNTFPPTFPDGLDVEIFSFNTLKKIHSKSKKKLELEHVTSYIRNHSHEFKIFNFKNKNDLSHLRWTVDEKNDLQVIRKIYNIMKPKLIFETKEVLKILKENPQIQKINEDIKRNEGSL